jgi:hypothetical protein
MAISIPTQIEQDFHSGKAQYKTFQTGLGAQSSIKVDPGSYIVLFGYTFYPAGGAFTYFDSVGGVVQLTPTQINLFGTQQLLFYTNGNFFPFVHNVNITQSAVVTDFDPATGQTTITSLAYDVDTAPIDVSVFIKTSRPISIAHGLLQSVQTNVVGIVPITEVFPRYLTYGGYGGAVAVQTQIGSVGNENYFLQPLFQGWSLPPYLYGLQPAEGTDQFWAKPDFISGMIPAQDHMDTLNLNLRNRVNANYLLTCHYALYSQNEL